MCGTLCWAASLCLLGWLMHALTHPDAYGNALFPPPDWLYLPEWRWLRSTCVTLTALLFLGLCVPYLFFLAEGVRQMPRTASVLLGTVLIAWGLVRATDRSLPPLPSAVQWMLPVRGRWVPGLLIAAGMGFCIAAAWGFR